MNFINTFDTVGIKKESLRIQNVALGLNMQASPFIVIQKIPMDDLQR